MAAGALASRGQAPLGAVLRQALKAFRQSSRIVEGPTEAFPAVGGSQRPDWGRVLRARAGVAAWYFPAMGTFLSWPFMAQYVLDGHMGQI
ncbi:hypothetical protein AAE478_006514 [Parahypoxylon ruwenzoriense]